MRRHLLVVLDLLYHEHNTSTLIKEDHEPEYSQRSVEIFNKIENVETISVRLRELRTEGGKGLPPERFSETSLQSTGFVRMEKSWIICYWKLHVQCPVNTYGEP
jgi:hypothetical protein